MIAVGDRVQVAIRYRARWAHGAAEALDGLTGTVEKLKEREPCVLVRFDAPAPTWSAHQTPPTAHWFDCSEVAELIGSAEVRT